MERIQTEANVGTLQSLDLPSAGINTAEIGRDVMRLSDRGFARFADFFTSELGIRMPDSKIGMVQSRLARRVRELGLSSVEQYGEYLFSQRHHEELDHLIDAITTHKTDFFREPEHFSYLTDVALPSLAAAKGRDRINVWSAACSSGEEPYTLAMVLSEYTQRQRDRAFAVLATDVSSGVLQKARRGVYPECLIDPVPLALRRKYLLRKQCDSEQLIRIVPELRQKVSFYQLNFMAPDYAISDTFDIIFLRNVLIYFNRDTQEKVVNKICRYLNPGGYLFVSHAESLTDLKLPLRRVQTSIHQMPF